MEIIFELLYEIIVEGAMGAVKDSDLPIGIRIGAGLFLFILYGGLLALFFVLARKAWSNGEVGWAGFLLILALALVVLIISVLVKPPKDTD